MDVHVEPDLDGALADIPKAISRRDLVIDETLAVIPDSDDQFVAIRVYPEFDAGAGGVLETVVDGLFQDEQQIAFYVLGKRPLGEVSHGGAAEFDLIGVAYGLGEFLDPVEQFLDIVLRVVQDPD